jgi:predicted TIM-barrel fold metal-dependent hydrolase
MWWLKMIVDAHYHLEERIEIVDRLLDQMDRHGIGRTVLIPALNDPITIDWVVEKFSGLGRRWRGLGNFFYGRMVTEDGKFVLLNKSYPIYEDLDNESVARVIQAHPDRFYGWIVVNPEVADPIAEVEKWVGKPGWIGVKAHPYLHRYPVAMVDDLAAYCSENGLPLLVHLGGDKKRGDYRFLPERYPSLKIIYAHAGVPFWEELWDYARKKANVFVDLSGEYLDDPFRLKSVQVLGAEKCLYGTDGPYGHPDTDGSYDHGKILNEIRNWPLSDEDKELVLGGNFTEIIGA